MSKPLLQIDLISEGFWDSFKKPLGFAGRVVKGAATIGKFAAEKLAPELTNPIKSAVEGIKDLNQRLIKATTPEAIYIENKLANQGYTVINDIFKIKKRSGDDKQLYKVSVKIRANFIGLGEPNPTKIFLVDADGNIVRDLSAKDASKGGKKPPKQRTSKVLTPQPTK